MSGLASATAACTLLRLATEVTVDQAGWLERHELELSAKEPACDRVVLHLPSDADLVGVPRVVQRLGDGIKRRQGPEVVERDPRSLRGEADVVVHLNDLLGGDRVTITWQRRLTRDASLPWEPPVGVVHADLAVADGVQVAPTGQVKPGQRGYWVGEPAVGDRATLAAAGRDQPWVDPFAEQLPPSRAPQVQRELELLVSPGDPQRALYPGGGSQVRTRLVLSFEAEDRDRAWRVPLGETSGDPVVAVEPSAGAASWTRHHGDIALVVPASEGPARVTVTWVSPDAPTHGAPAPDETLTVRADGGKVVWDTDGSWFLAGIHDQAILPSRSALVRGLDRRFRVQAIPEPGLPNELRGLPPGWDLAASVPDALRARAEVFDNGSDPLWVRKLIGARNSGGLTPTEAAVMAWLYALQGRLDARWVLVRPAPDGPGGDASPAGYRSMVVRVDHDGETRWLDPACAVCAPFELRPELEGASALGQEVDHTSDPSPGRWTAAWGPDFVRWELTGPAALELRRWLQDLPASDRHDALAGRMAGPGASLVEAEGLDQPGAPIRVAARGGTGVRADPLALPPVRPDGTVWLPWVGVRERLVSGGELPPANADGGAIAFDRSRTDDGVVTERLEVRQRLVPAAAVAAVDAARATTPPVEPTAESPEGPTAESPTEPPAPR